MAANDPLEQPTEVLDTVHQEQITVENHPRFSTLVTKARGVAGLAGFALAAWSSYHAHGFAGALLRGVIVGVVCQLLVGLVAVALSRQLVAAEIRAHRQRLAAARENAGEGR